MAFAGVPCGLIGFLAGLAAENNREWFEPHRAEDQAHPDWLLGSKCLVQLLPIIDGLAPLARWLVPFSAG